MRAELEVLLKTLRDLKRDGVRDVFVSEPALARLRERVEEAASSAAVPAAPPPPESVPAENFSEKPSRSREKTSAEQPPPRRAENLAQNTHATETKSAEFDPEESAARVEAVPATGTKTERLAALGAALFADPVCNAHLHPGKKLVFGEGSPDAAVFFCGEAPGAEEETAGRPFVGPAGQLLTKMIGAMGLAREEVYIGNILKWRPETDSAEGNRPPTPEEMSYCLPYLAAQIETVAPRVIVALGLSATNGLLGFDPARRISAMRGKTLDFRGTPLVATFHPSYLLRNGTTKAKRAAWEDFLRAMAIAQIPISERQQRFFLPR